MKLLHSDRPTGDMLPNLAAMLNKNSRLFGNKVVFQQKNDQGVYEGIRWSEFYQNIRNIVFHLQQQGFAQGDKMAIFSRNCLSMLELELAVMASGGIAVPIFAHFKRQTADLLLRHSNARWLALEGDTQLANISEDLLFEHIFVFDANARDDRFPQLQSFHTLTAASSQELPPLDENIHPDTICLNMYTSGTMGMPKCVQLTHRNILSQQAALQQVLPINEQDRFLSYLPWHHSFGGIFELFGALYNGATYFLESSYGKDPKVIFDNWKWVKPTVFFSVPKVYQSLVDLSREDHQAEKVFFNSGLKFIFTAAAALPERLSDIFAQRGIPVIEGWGLTETSPCCTLTDPSMKRLPGVVGKPIPGISLRIADDGEIQVKGPNVMAGYYHNDEANQAAFTPDGWYRTGDVGEITEQGLKLISRKDRIFKLSNGEKVVPTDLERAIETHCHYVQYAVVTGNGEEYPVALIFPNKKLLENPDYAISPEEGCFCPRSLNELGRCLTGCLQTANNSIGQKFAKVKSAAIILDELSLDNHTLTPSMKMAPKNVIDRYRAHLLNLYGEAVPVDEEVYVIELEPHKSIEPCTK